jgi:2'-5' RNA ligase
MDLFGYSLWLVPPPDISDKYARIIRDLSKEYQSAVFEPHITLAGEIPSESDTIVQETTKILDGFAPLPFRLTSLMYQDFYYRALYVLVDPAPRLVDLQRKITEKFGMKGDSFMPHLSLLYGKFDTSIKEKIIQQFGREQNDHFVVDTIYLIQMAGNESTWKTIHTFKLHGIAES